MVRRSGRRLCAPNHPTLEQVGYWQLSATSLLIGGIDP